MASLDEGEPKPADWGAIPRADDRVWGPDLFAWCYDHLDATQTWRGQDPPEEIEHYAHVVRWRDAIRAEGGLISDGLLGSIRAAIEKSGHEPAGLLGLLVAIDRAYVGIRVSRPCIVPDERALAALLEVWEEKCSLELRAAGRVLRKGALWRAGSSLAHYCADLARVPEHLARRVDVTRQLTGATLGDLLREQAETATLNVAFVPALASADDAAFLPVDRGSARLFSVELADTSQRALADGMPALVRRLEAAEVNLALLPETVATADVGEALRRAMIANNEARLSAGALPSLRLAVLGVGGTRSNVAKVFASDGTPLLEQPKANAWRLDEFQQERYGLTPALGGGDRDEDIVPGASQTFLDDPGLGRIAVLICEDLARGETAWQFTTAATPTIVLGPVCDGSLTRDRWAFQAAKSIGDEPGALTCVINSFVLSEYQRDAQGGSASTPVGIGIVLHPDDWDQTEVVQAVPNAAAVEIRRLTWTQSWG
jgi:hypothetical protein